MKTVAEYFNELTKTINTVEGVYKKDNQFIFVKVKDRGLCIDGSEESPIAYDVHCYRSYNSLGLIFAEYGKLGQTTISPDSTEIHNILGEKIMTLEENNKFWKEAWKKVNDEIFINSNYAIDNVITLDEKHILSIYYIYDYHDYEISPGPSYDIAKKTNEGYMRKEFLRPANERLKKLLEQIFKEFTSLPNI